MLTYRWPKGECSPASVWIKADRLHTPVPRESARRRKLYRDRAGVERVRAPEVRMGGSWPCVSRGVERVRLHADLTLLFRLAVALAKARNVPLAA